MKHSPVSPATLFTFLLFPLLFLLIKRKRKYAIAYLVFMGFLSSGCFQNYYQTNTNTKISDSTVLALKSDNKYIIVHLKNGNYELKNISINNNLVEADVDTLDPDHSKYLNSKTYTYNTYKKKYENSVLNEVHIYAPNQASENNKHLSIPVKSITRVDIYTKDQGQTKTNHAISVVGVILGGALVVLAIALVVACSCPQVYTYDGSQYQFKSGVYSGAIYSSLERTDYLPLDNLTPVNGKYKFRLTNNQQEEQFINQLQLINVPHDNTTSVLLDRHGLIHTYQQPEAPLSTSLKNDESGLTFKMKDGNAYMFDQKSSPDSEFGSVILNFDKPADTKQAKLIVNAKNTLWAGYIFNEFSSLFGDKFQKYQAKQDKANGEKIQRWQKEQALSLMVYVETEKGWQLADYYPTTGNTAGRDMIMTVKIPDTRQNKIRIKLESAFMFWELDYVAIDFSQDLNLKPEFIHIATALKSNDSSIEVSNLTAIDNQYSTLVQDEFLSVEFPTPTTTASQNSYFLVSTGYYHSLKQYAGKPDLAQLNHFKKKGFFSEFSEHRFMETQKLMARGINLQTEPENQQK